jgi:purine-binding chemotaxis protein CheW
MSDSTSHIADRAAQLRREFDRSFAEPFRVDREDREDLLGIRVGTHACALRLSEIAGLFIDKKITRVPGGVPALRGIAGFRGALLPVYDLAMLLGHGGAPARRWLVVAAAAPVAFAFDAFERQLRVAREEILPHSARQEGMSYAREIVRTRTFIGPVLSLPAILAALKAPATAQVGKRSNVA